MEVMLCEALISLDQFVLTYTTACLPDAAMLHMRTVQTVHMVVPLQHISQCTYTWTCQGSIRQASKHCGQDVVTSQTVTDHPLTV